MKATPFSVILAAPHLPSHQYKLALFTAAAALNKKEALFTYAATLSTYKNLKGEITGKGYSAGGLLLSQVVTLGFNGAAPPVLTFGSPVKWPNATFSARGGLIYNNSLPDKNGMMFIDFGSDYEAVNGPFSVFL